MRIATVPVLLAALLVTSTGCATEARTYGAASAGPTRKSEPLPLPPPVPMEQVTRPDYPKLGPAVCELFTTREMSRALGLAVSSVEVSREGKFTVCTWHAVEPSDIPHWLANDPTRVWADGKVTIRRAKADQYPWLEQQVLTSAKKMKASARKELPRLGARAFAIGASVSGIPIWQSAAQHGGLATAVRLSGRHSAAGVATVAELMSLVVSRS